MSDDYVAFCRYIYNESGGIQTIETCDSGAEGAFKVYRNTALTLPVEAMTTKTTEGDLVEEVEELLPKLPGADRRTNLLRRLVDEVKRRDELIIHMHVHSSYSNNGYMQMTTPQKDLYDSIWNESVRKVDEEEEYYYDGWDSKP